MPKEWCPREPLPCPVPTSKARPKPPPPKLPPTDNLDILPEYAAFSERSQKEVTMNTEEKIP